MNLITLVVGVVIAAVFAGGYYVSTQPAKDDAMMQKETLPSTPSEAIDAAEDAKAMMEKQDEMAGEMMKDEDGAMMKKDDSMMMEDGSMMQKDDAMMQDDTMMKKDDAMAKPGSYVAYAPEKLAMANSGDVVLFFRASWCPTCKSLDANIKANAGDIPSGLTILDVNYDTATDLKKKYGVTYQHTLVQVDASGNQIAKWSGSPSLADIVSKVQ
jgi:thiol-disulfide isomerase/thioredoxin